MEKLWCRQGRDATCPEKLIVISYPESELKSIGHRRETWAKKQISITSIFRSRSLLQPQKPQSHKMGSWATLVIMALFLLCGLSPPLGTPSLPSPTPCFWLLSNPLPPPSTHLPREVNETQQCSKQDVPYKGRLEFCSVGQS